MLAKQRRRGEISERHRYFQLGRFLQLEPKSALNIIDMKLNLTCLTVFCCVAFSGIASAADAPVYPLKTCVVSGEKLGTMGKPAVLNYEGREVQFCCKACIKDFNKDPKKFIALLDAAKKAN